MVEDGGSYSITILIIFNPFVISNNSRSYKLLQTTRKRRLRTTVDNWRSKLGEQKDYRQLWVFCYLLVVDASSSVSTALFEISSKSGVDKILAMYLDVPCFFLVCSARMIPKTIPEIIKTIKTWILIYLFEYR